MWLLPCQGVSGVHHPGNEGLTATTVSVAGGPGGLWSALCSAGRLFSAGRGALLCLSPQSALWGAGGLGPRVESHHHAGQRGLVHRAVPGLQEARSRLEVRPSSLLPPPLGHDKPLSTPCSRSGEQTSAPHGEVFEAVIEGLLTAGTGRIEAMATVRRRGSVTQM